jgi:hypothetical protein
MGKTYKDLKKQGKHVFDGPNVKKRKHFAPATKTEKPKKGKGSYDRGNAFDEDEQGYTVKTVIRRSKKNPSMFVAVAGGKIVGKGNNKKQLMSIVSGTIPKLFRGGMPQFIDKSDPDYQHFSKSISDDPYDPGFEEDEESYPGQYKKGETSEAKKRDLDAIRKNRKNKPKSKLGDLKELEDTDKTPLKDRIENALKESTNLSKFIEAIMTSNHAEAHKQLKQAVNSKIQNRIAQEINNPLF